MQKDCVWEAAASGGKAAAWAGLCSASTIGLANHFSEGFRHALGVSGKAALVVSPCCNRHLLVHSARGVHCDKHGPGPSACELEAV